jgi:glycolate oxidase FAD binding subunit
MTTSFSPHSAAEVQDAVRTQAKLHVRGAGTKTGLHLTTPNAVTLDMRQLSGVIEYDPQEFVLTALAGTPVHAVQALLAEKGQYLPFDPLLVQRGATLGGTVAANASGPGRLRFGGVRDFLIGTKFVDGAGTLLRGGGKVVKNAAGFDYPKLMVGALGQLGVLIELTFKVFPKPEDYMTLLVQKTNLQDTLQALYKLNTTPLDIDALDFYPVPNSPAHFELAVRVGGLTSGLLKRVERIQQLVGFGTVLQDHADQVYWQAVREFDWAAQGTVSKVPITPAKIAALEAQLDNGIARRYSVAGNVAYIGQTCGNKPAGFSGLLLLGQTHSARIGDTSAPNAFAIRIRQALDAQNKFV